MDPVIEFVLDEPEERVDLFAAALEQGRVLVNSTDARLKREFIHGPNSLARMIAVLRSWRDQGVPLTCSHGRSGGSWMFGGQWRTGDPSASLSGVGRRLVAGECAPRAPSSMRCWATLADRYSLCRTRSGSAKASPADVVAQLAELSRIGVDVTFILDLRYQGGWNITQLKSAWPKGRRRPTIWSWQHGSDTIAKLHAKVIVVDRRDVLITSANLTGHGIDTNLELGLRVLGQPAEDTAAHFDRLIQDGEFERVEW